MSKINTKIGTGSALVIALLAFGAFAGAAAIVTKNQFSLAPASLAESGSGGDDNNDDEDEDKNDDSSSKSEQEKEKKSEEAKKKAEREREDAKKQLERSNRGSDDDSADDNEDINDDNGGNKDDGEDVTKVEDENKGGDNEGMFKDRDKTLSKLQEEIAKAEKEILEKQAEGVDVTAALARLAQAKAQVASVGGAFDANDLEAAKRLAKQIKKTAHFTEKDLHDAEKIAEELAKVEKRFGQVTQKIATLEGLGGDVSAFETRLASLRSDFSALKASAAATPGVITRDTVKAFEKQVKRLKSLVEGSIFALGGTDDDDLFEDHEDDADDLFEDLNDVAEIEDGDDNGVSNRLQEIVREHKVASNTIKESLKDIKNRGELAKTLFGADSRALDTLNREVAAQNIRAAKLELESAQVSDPDLKGILTDQAAALRNEVLKLQSYIAAEGSQSGIFGALLKLFR